MFRFENFWVLFLLIPLGFFFVFCFYFLKRKQTQMQTLFSKDNLKLLSPPGVDKIKKRSLIFHCTIMLLITLAWARPQFGMAPKKVVNQGIEIMLLVDVSNSMLAEDVRPSRLELAKKEITKLMDVLGGDKVGLVAFAGSALLVSPLTTDKVAMRMFVESLSPKMVSTQGTAFDKALDEAGNSFLRGGDKDDEEIINKKKLSKIVVLVSDGEDHNEGALKVVKTLKKKGIRTFSLAVGTERGGRIPIRDSRDQLIGYKRSQDGVEINSKVSGDFLKEIAESGAGTYYKLRAGGNQVSFLREDILELDQAEFDSIVSADYKEYYQFPLLLAVFLILFDLFSLRRKKMPLKWLGRFETK